VDNKQTEPSPITIQDLQNVLVVIDLASTRGAVRAAELSAVGALYDKINRFVKEQSNSEGTANV
jgi:hypothetical protein